MKQYRVQPKLLMTSKFGENGETEQEAFIDHDQNLERLLERAQEKELKMNAQKLKYRQRDQLCREPTYQLCIW